MPIKGMPTKGMWRRPAQITLEKWTQRWRIPSCVLLPAQALADFIEERAPAIDKLQVTYTQGAPPTIFLQNEEGETLEEVAITGSWQPEHIEDFLREKLQLETLGANE